MAKTLYKISTNVSVLSVNPGGLSLHIMFGSLFVFFIVFNRECLQHVKWKPSIVLDGI